MSLRPLALVGAAALALTACSPGEPPAPAPQPRGVSVTAGPTATASPKSGATLDPSQFAAALKAADTVILDVRTAAEFAEGHIPGAINLDVESPDFADAVRELDPSVPYAVYGRSGTRSQVALELMTAGGLTAAYHLGGGIGAWERAGGEIAVP